MLNISPLKKSLKSFPALFKKWRAKLFRLKKGNWRKSTIVLLGLVIISVVLFKVSKSLLPSAPLVPNPSPPPDPSPTTFPTPTLTPTPKSSAKGSLIYWRANRKLTWDDFQGPAPDNPPGNVILAQSLGIGWEPDADCFSLESGLRQCNLRMVKIWAQATVDPQKSWVRDGYRTPDRLDHEQLHFDIAELFARKFREQTRSFIGRNFTAQAESGEAAIQQAFQDFRSQIDPIWTSIKNEYSSTQDRYDAETAHSRNPEAQAAWIQKIRSQL